MKAWASIGNDRAAYPCKTSVILLSLLVVAATCAARQVPPRQTQPAPARRTPAGRLKTIQLAAPSTGSAVSVEQAMLALRNLQPPGNQRLELPKIGQLAWAVQGVAAGPAAAAAAPVVAPTEIGSMKVYFALPDGIYLYGPADHTLQQTSDDDVREAMAAALFNQAGAPTGGCQVIVTASAQEFGKRHGTRGRTVMFLQAGRMSQNLLLEAIAQGLTFIPVDSFDASAVRRIALLPRTQEPLFVACVGYPLGQAPAAPAQGQVSQATALLVVPSQGFQDEELLGTKRALELAGVQVVVAGTRMGLLAGMLGGSIQPDILLHQASIDNFHAVVFIGGNTIDYLSNPAALNLARQAIAQRKVLAAIGTAPGILASAGVLKGVRATAFLSEQARLVQSGAVYTGAPVEKDGLIVTATGPLAVVPFARTIVDSLAELAQTSP